MPRGRYFHAAEIVQSRREIYIFGGLGSREDGFNCTLNDTWKFVLKSQRWIHVQVCITKQKGQRERGREFGLFHDKSQ